MRRYIYWHICVLNDWEEIVRDQAVKINANLDSFDEVRVCILGDKGAIPLILSLFERKVVIRGSDPDITKYEAFTLEKLHEDSQTEQFQCLYIHNKGTTQFGNKRGNVKLWRNMMEYFLLESCHHCFALLEYYDTLGCCLLDKGNIFSKDQLQFTTETHNAHYSGNFWWARSEYIKTLPPFPVGINMHENKNYYICERWVLQKKPDVKLCCLYSERRVHFYNAPPDPNYKVHVGRYTTSDNGVILQIDWSTPQPPPPPSS